MILVAALRTQIHPFATTSLSHFPMNSVRVWSCSLLAIFILAWASSWMLPDSRPSIARHRFQMLQMSKSLTTHELLWMDTILHNLETMGNHGWWVFAGESPFQGFLGGVKWISSIHTMVSYSTVLVHVQSAAALALPNLDIPKRALLPNNN